MITLLGSLLGFASGIIPGILTYFNKKNDREFELEKIKLVQSMEREVLDYHLGKVHLIEANKSTEIIWVDAIRGLVRPAITLAFMGLLGLHIWVEFDTWYNFEWTEELQVIFATIISFWFGNRTISKLK